MAMDIGLEDSNVDHFIISTLENQFLLIFIDQVETVKGVLNMRED
jgi:hypothetical protein